MTNKHIYFTSVFNEKTLFFGKETKVKIPYTAIETLEKQMSALVFDNSIAIVLKGRNFPTLFFASYVYRDQCFEMI